MKTAMKFPKPKEGDTVFLVSTNGRGSLAKRTGTVEKVGRKYFHVRINDYSLEPFTFDFWSHHVPNYGGYWKAYPSEAEYDEEVLRDRYENRLVKLFSIGGGSRNLSLHQLERMCAEAGVSLDD